MIEIYSTHSPYQRSGKEKSIFLVGPTPRSESVASWRPEAVRILRNLNFDGHVLIPEPENGQRFPNYDAQVDWERIGLHNCHVIAAWVPRDMSTMPALTTNVEFGFWAAHEPAKLFYGRPEGAAHTRYLDWLYHLQTGRKAMDSLEKLLKEVVLSFNSGSDGH